MSEHPVRLVVSDDLTRSRLTVLFRLLLAIPHIIWLVLWSIAVFFLAIFGWLMALVSGRLPGWLHRFFAAYIRYVTHLTAYVTIVANPYPPFDGRPGVYPIDVELPPEPQRQSRWLTGFRLVLAIPALVLSQALGGGLTAGGTGTQGSDPSSEGGGVGTSAGGMLVAVAIFGWFTSLVRGRMARGLRDAGAYGTGYGAQVAAYLLLVTERYPNADPAPLLETVEPPPEHVVHIAADDDDQRRSRLTVFFRLLLAIPHIVWLVLWSVAVFFAVVVQWFVTLVRGVPAAGLHRFIAAYLRYTVDVIAFLFLVANPFPGFTGTPGRYPIEIALPPPQRQNRWKTGFRLILAFPALVFAGALGTALFVASVLTWFVGLFLARQPGGLHNLSVYALRYQIQADAYLLLITDAYPHASPLEGVAEPVVEEAPALSPAW
jgi:hypothetical protein